MNVRTSALAEYLDNIPPGPIADISALTNRLCTAWPELRGSGEQSTTPSKLAGRIEEPIWNPPNLKFVIERHGPTVNGSVWANLHEWVVDVRAGTAAISSQRRRLVEAMDKPVKLRPLAEAIAKAMSN